MTSTFLLPLSIGACTAVGGDLMTNAFGVVALVAMTPLIAIQIMGLIYNFKTRDSAEEAVAVPAEIEDDIEDDICTEEDENEQ
jgi:hypothetical protein